MSIWAKTTLGVATLATGVVLTLAYRGSYSHAEYYMGVEPDTLSCMSCHVEAWGGGIRDRTTSPSYYNPVNLAVSADGSRLFVTAEEADALLIVDVAQRQLEATIPVGRRPTDIVLDPTTQRAYVSNRWSNTVSVIDLGSRQVVETLATGIMPSGLALGPGSRSLFVANWQSHDISVIDLPSGQERVRLAGGSNPNQVGLSSDGSLLAISNELSFVAEFQAPPVSEVTLVDTVSSRVVARYPLQGAHLLEGIVILPEGDLAVVSLVRPKNLVPIIQVAQGWVVTNGMGIVDLKTGTTYELLLDEANRYFADPSDVVVSPDGRHLFVAHSGVDVISVVDLGELRKVLAEITPEEITSSANRLDLSPRYVAKRIETGSNPKGMAVSASEGILYVAERLQDSVLAIDLTTLEPLFRIDLNDSPETVRRRGEKLFNTAKMTFQGQFSCRSCHPDDHVDRLQYDFEADGLGRNIVDNRTLLGISKTGPFKWNGKNTSLFMQCGIRFARILTRREPFSMDQLTALVAFIRSREQPPNPYRAADGTLSATQKKGKFFFERDRKRDGSLIAEKDRCVTCHPPPLFTNRAPEIVGTRGGHDTSERFDTPQLINIYNSAPYLHDGRAKTLEEIWTVFNPDDAHGITSDMSKQDLNALIEYLKTL